MSFYTKPFLMPLLMVYFSVSSVEKKSLLNFGLLALLFSWAGDVVLMFQDRGELYFMMGLGSFLLAHVIYIFTYKKARWEEEENGLLPTQKIRYVFILVLAGCGLVYVLLPKLGELTIPVIIYASIIVAMTIFALNRFGFTSQTSFGLVFLGAVLFMMSDSILAINKFMEPLPIAGFWIMLTYILAQFTIVQGLLLHKKREPSS
nr:lysoplasmalogenase [Fulvivirga marina]